MTAIEPATKLQEVIKLFTRPYEIKDLRPFCDFAHKRMSLKRDLTQLIQKDPVAAYTGLAIIAGYENKHEEAHDYFKRAFLISDKSYSSTMNYASSLLSNGEFESAIELYKKVFVENPNNIRFLVKIIDPLVKFLFIEEAEFFLRNAKGIDGKYINRIAGKVNYYNLINDAILKMNINIDNYREILKICECVYYDFFTITSSVYSNIQFDNSQEIIWLSTVVIQKNEDEILDYEIISKMNDLFQDKVLDIVKSDRDNQLKQTLEKVCCYFRPNINEHIDEF